MISTFKRQSTMMSLSRHKDSQVIQGKHTSKCEKDWSSVMAQSRSALEFSSR